MRAGERVIVHGQPGVVLFEYLPGIWEVRLRSGIVCVPLSEIHREGES